MRPRDRRPWTAALFLLLAGALSLWAATQNALVTGAVFDHTGASVVGATVRLINASNGFSQGQITDLNGSYTFSNVPPAENYVISVEKAGFATVIRPGLTIQVGEAKLILPPFLLEPAQAPGQEIEQAPTAAPAVSVELVSTTLGGVVDSRTVRTLPLVGRDFIDLALLIPGTYPVEQGSVLEGASLVVNGARPNMNNFLLEGADNNDYTINQSLPFQIVEAMQEFRVQSSTSTAEFGRSGGAQINTISRSGLNDLHGTLLWFHRNSRLSANNFFSAFNGGTFDQFVRSRVLDGLPSPLGDPTLAALYDERNPQVIQHQFGANLGGALAKDKLFGFFNWESVRVANPRPIFERVPGLFLRNPAVGLDPGAVALYNLYPLPNAPTTAFTNPDSQAFFVGESENRTTTDNFLERMDWRISDRASMSFKHNIQRIEQIQGGDTPATSAYGGSGTRVSGRNQNFSYNYLHQFTPRTANEFRFGWNRFRLTTGTLDSNIDAASLGFQNLNFRDRGLPTVTTGGVFTERSLFSTLGADLNVPSNRVNSVWSWADNLTLTRGRHTGKFGFEFRQTRLNVLNEALGRGLLTFFSGPFVAVTGAPDIASIARVSSEFGGGFDRFFRTLSLNAFVQDTWRPRSNFTVNYGLRYEVNTAPVELRDRLVNFFPSLGGLVRAGSTTVWDPFGGVLGTAPGPVPRAGFSTDKDNWGPHIGFAWDPWNTGKTVVRAGYALVYDQQPLEPSVNMLHNPPFVMQDFSFFPNFTLADTFSRFSASSFWLRLPYSTTARDPQTQTSYLQQFNLGVQQQLGKHVLFEVAYVGSAGRRLPRLRDLSRCTPTLFFFAPAACFDFATNPFLFSSILFQENTAHSNFHSLQASFEVRGLHGLQLRLHYQLAKSIDNASSLQPQVFVVSPPIASFLVSDSFINPDNFAGANNISPGLSLRPTLPILTTRPRLPQDSSNLAGERARSDFDVQHRAVIHYIYDIPRWAAGIGDGWQLAGITTLQSGQPYTVFVDFFGIPLRPTTRRPADTNNDNPNGAIDNGIPIGAPESAFGLGRSFRLLPGSLGRNTFSGPGLVNFDLSILKNTYFGGGERINLQFRVEFFNLFNNGNFRQPFSQGGLVFTDLFGSFGPPGGSFVIRNPFFGQIVQARPGREIQGGIKLSF